MRFALAALLAIAAGAAFANVPTLRAQADTRQAPAAATFEAAQSKPVAAKRCGSRGGVRRWRSTYTNACT